MTQKELSQEPEKKVKIKIGGIIENHDLVLVSILSAPNQPGIAGRVLSFLGQNHVNIEFITESWNREGTADITFCFQSGFKKIVQSIIEGLRNVVQAKGDRWLEDVGIICIYGPHFREKPLIAGQTCATLGQAEINILGISTSISSVSLIIDEKEMDVAKTALEDAFELPD